MLSDEVERLKPGQSIMIDYSNPKQVDEVRDLCEKNILVKYNDSVYYKFGTCILGPVLLDEDYFYI